VPTTCMERDGEGTQQVVESAGAGHEEQGGPDSSDGDEAKMGPGGGVCEYRLPGAG